VVDGDRLVGIVSRRDLLRTLVRPDEEIAADVLRLVEAYTQELGCWTVAVSDGVATVRRSRGTGDSDATERDSVNQAVQTLAQTVPGVVAARVVSGGDSAAHAAAHPSA
jgi:CBS domain-containing protein